MFKRRPDPTFKYTVDIPSPGGGDVQKLPVEFRYKDRLEREAFMRSLIEANDGEGRTDDEFLSEIIVSWEAEDFPYTPENLKELLTNYYSASQAFLVAYERGLVGEKEKN